MKNQTRLILISVVGAVVSLGLTLFVVKPNLRKVTDLKNQVSTKKTELKQLEEQIVIYKNSQHDLSLASGKELISSTLVPGEELQLAIIEIENAALLTGVTESINILDDVVKTTKPQVVPGKTYLAEVEYDISTSSDFIQLINFIKYLEHLPHFTEIARISLQSAGGSSAEGSFARSGVINGSINSVFFVQKK